MATPHVALLRGVNVSGKNKLPMKDLKEIFAEVGCENVRTYIQSGNVVFEATATVAKGLPEKIAVLIKERFGIHSPVIVRTAKELAAVVEGNPFLKAGAPETELHVMFLADAPGASRIETLDPARSPGDEFAVHGKDLYLRLPNGAGKSKLTNAYVDSKLGTVSTARNWRTVTTLLGMMEK
jgi:uncharacterized protein (DUF1697 family)